MVRDAAAARPARGPGVTMAFHSTSVPEIAAWAADAEQRGVPAVWLSEAWRELAVPLTAVAAATHHIPIGAGVMQIFPAHPVLTALQAMQLQELSGGRFELGLGLGAGFVVERWFGVPYERPLRRMKEFVEVVRGVMDSRHGRPFSYAGEIFRVHKYTMPFGTELPDVPVSIAAVGPKMLELAGEVADGVILGAIHSPAYLAEVRRRLAAGNLSGRAVRRLLRSSAGRDEDQHVETGGRRGRFAASGSAQRACGFGAGAASALIEARARR